ncbi:MAG: 50S ribosomal protein L25 [Pontiella sp.]
MEDTKLIAKKRDLEGTSNSRRMRALGTLPGVLYGSSEGPVSIEVNAHKFGIVLNHHTSESMILEIELDGVDVSVLVKEIQRHPVSSDLIHVDFQRVVAGEVMHMDVLLELVGEPEGVKAGGTLDQVMHSIGIECLPKDLVEVIEIDVSDLAIGSNLHISDLGIDSKFKVLVDESAIVCSVAGPKVESEDDEEGAESGEPEVITEKNAE